MTRPVFSLLSAPDSRFLTLVWQVFFEERGRGLSLARHFPWLGVDPQVRYALLQERGELLAGLVARPVPSTTVAAIGLVCVRAERRGEGLSRLLLEHSLQALDQIGFTAQTLWTGKPDVYRRQGFVVDDVEVMFGIDDLPKAKCSPIHALPWPVIDDLRGLPPYALSAQLLRRSDGNAQAIVLTDPKGCAVAEWRGDDEAVIQLLASAMPASWRLHARRGDTLPAALAAYGAQLRPLDSSLQMWREPLGAGNAQRPVLRVLDRI